jgi:glycosidase
LTVPDWVFDAVFYQIFPDRFANGDSRNDPPNVHPWGASPTRTGFQGGDLQGVRQKLGYLHELGINAIYLNPIFLSPSTHRYDTVDYFRIDPKLGSLSDFHALIEDAHHLGMRVILDGVFNHCARGFFAFSDLLENEADSPYRDWFHVARFPLRAYEPGKARNYQAWWGYKSMPKFNTANPAVRKYILDAARYWIDQGADGWRLDVPNEIDDDAFWAEFRQTVRSANQQAYLLGEIWETGPRWVNDTHFDGLMNYPVLSALLAFLNGQTDARDFSAQVTGLLSIYPETHLAAMYNLLGSHDTERVITRLGGDARKVELAYLFQFAYPGIPSIYYGDEIGLEGGKDPDCRRAFPWQEEQQNTGLRASIQQMIAARKASIALRRGSLRLLAAEKGARWCAFARLHADENVVVLLNGDAEPANVSVPVQDLRLENGTALRDLLGKSHAVVQDGCITARLGPYSGAYLQQAV